MNECGSEGTRVGCNMKALNDELDGVEHGQGEANSVVVMKVVRKAAGENRYRR